MTRKVVQIHNAEARIISSLISERDSAEKSLTVALNVVLARHSVVGMFVALEGNEIYLDVPDTPGKRDRTESPQTGAGIVGVIGAAPAPETPSEGKPAGNSGGIAPVVGAPDAGIATDTVGPVDSMGKDTGIFPADLPGVDPSLREHS